MIYMRQGILVREVLPHIIECTRKLYDNEAEISHGMALYIINEAMYYVLPVILTIGIIFSIINTVVSAKMTADSHECYLTTFNLCSCLHLIAACVAQLPNYVTQTGSAYITLLPYLPAVENWLWYSCTWLLITVVIERAAHGLCGQWHASFGKIHGVLVSILMVTICFVSTLPQYWEYGLEEYTGSNNCSRRVLTPRDAVIEDNSNSYIIEYEWFHWYEMVISIGLPYVLLPMLILPLVCIKMHIYTSMPSAYGKGGSIKYSVGSSIKDQLKQEKSFNKLIFTMSVLYLLMSAPRNVMRLIHNPPVSLQISTDELLISTLFVLFEIIFYIYFSILFFLYLCFGIKFRTTLYQLCCCKKSDALDYY
ncbi:hypothetical protein EB796_019455 [Bugula neritina]|uniref:G-protein coupled receptors family 1 profile domain-containing protein n=1 Tax=Bugula neritina TaxID=10212 RepID=A0A7J7J8F8_BUGNE|nr:hypothetical protein EB796_019455 [Bugula neritina]